MKIDRNYAVYPGSANKIRDQARAESFPPLGAAILARITEIRNHGGDSRGASPPTCVGHEEQFD
jgi:hypothetical protein